MDIQGRSAQALQALKESIDILLAFDKKHGTDITTAVKEISVGLDKDQFTQSEYEEFLGDELNMLELDAILKKDEDLRIIQDLLRKIPGLLTSIAFP